jgi:hypothetical protein
VEIQGLSHWYPEVIIHQDKEFNVTMDNSRYAKSIVTRFLESSDIKKSNMPHGSINPAIFVLTSKDLITMPKKFSEIQDAYNLDYASCIGSLIYMFYTRPDNSFAFNKKEKYSKQPGEKHNNKYNSPRK